MRAKAFVILMAVLLVLVLVAGCSSGRVYRGIFVSSLTATPSSGSKLLFLTMVWESLKLARFRIQ